LENTAHRILITGTSGVLGRHALLQLLGRSGTEVLAIHRQASPEYLPVDGVRHETVNFGDRAALAALFEEFQPTCLIHCAASGMIFPHIEWFKLIRFNVDATLLLFELASMYPGCHFVHVSTGLAYRSTGQALKETDALENVHPYGASKAAADLLLRSAAVEFGVPLTVFRPFSFTGTGDTKTRLFPALLRAAVEKKALPLSAGDQVRDFCSAREIARAIVMSVDRVPDAKVPALFNLGSGQALNLRTLIERVVEELAIPVRLEFGARPYGPFEAMHLVADISRANLELGWRSQHNLAHAVWQLAEDSFSSLKLKEPKESIPC